jgi:hypothetical protein
MRRQSVEDDVDRLHGSVHGSRVRLIGSPVTVPEQPVREAKLGQPSGPLPLASSQALALPLQQAANSWSLLAAAATVRKMTGADSNQSHRSILHRSNPTNRLLAGRPQLRLHTRLVHPRPLPQLRLSRARIPAGERRLGTRRRVPCLRVRLRSSRRGRRLCHPGGVPVGALRTD